MQCNAMQEKISCDENVNNGNSRRIIVLSQSFNLFETLNVRAISRKQTKTITLRCVSFKHVVFV